MTNNLMNNSPIYHKTANIYDVFSKCEDYENLVFKTLLPEITGKTVLDLGCGSGKYLELFAPYAKHITGLDAAKDQLRVAKDRTRKFMNVDIVHGNAENAELPYKQYDIVIACWMLGTVAERKHKENILHRMQNILSPEGHIFLVENSENSEFESIRGRVNDPKNRTHNYNNWLQNEQDFQIFKELNSYFKFSNTKEAQDIFSAIWGEEKRLLIQDRKIEHKITIFKC